MQLIATFAAFVISGFCTFVITRTQFGYNNSILDSDIQGPQKFHIKAVPRIGGLSVFAGVLSTEVLRTPNNAELHNTILMLALSAIPVFIIGLTEDITKKISIRTRLVVICLGSALFIYFLQAPIKSIDIPYLDGLFKITAFSYIFTVFAVAGLSNSYNIIDGFNGLASMVGIITLSALAFMSAAFDDYALTYMSLIMIGSIAGFFIWNFPKGMIFLGDGGAYLIGFWVAGISILIVGRHEEVSPWFALLINAYPISETIFSIYRRQIYRKNGALHADGIHMHTLIYRRVLSKYRDSPIKRNSKTAPYLWVMTALSVIPAVIFYDSTFLLMAIYFTYVILYIRLYKIIIRFKTPKLFK